MKTLAIVIPAFNEDTRIGDVLQRIPKNLNRIKDIKTIVVDDGSSDSTYEIAHKYTDIVLKHKINLGAGSATLTGLKYAKDFIKPDILVTLDSDGQHNPFDIKNIIKPILDKTADVVIGSRMIDTNNMPITKHITNKIANFVTYLFSGVWTTDSQSGFRAYSRKAMDLISFRTTGYEYCSETFSEIGKHKLKFCEVPIDVIYDDYSSKKGQPISNSLNIIIKLITKSLTK